MDLDHLDTLARSLAATHARRQVLGALGAVPLAGGLLALLAPEDDAAAKERRRRRKGRHKRRKAAGKRQRRDRRKAHQKRKRHPRPEPAPEPQPQPACTPEPASETCAGQCGSVTNTCQQVVECEPCCTGLTPTDDLAQAIAEALDGETLRLCPGTWVLPEMLVITRPLTIVGAGAGKTILDGDTKHRVLAIAADVPVTLEAMRLTNGANDFGGGAIHNLGTLTLVDAELTHNACTSNVSSGGGGAIITYNDVTLRNTVVRENTSTRFGGGIRIDRGTVTLEAGSSVERNEAQYGGGVHMEQHGKITLKQGSRFHGNEASVEGGGIRSFHGVVTLETGSALTGNTAPTGGAIINISGTVTIAEGVLICGNSEVQCVGSAPYPPGACPSTADGACP